jgi:hypothetical protein
MLAAYFPNDASSVDRGFAWAIYETLEPTRAERYYQSVLDKKYSGRQEAERPKIGLSRKWLGLLL